MACRPDDGPIAAPRHGGNVQAAAGRLGLPVEALLDFSASINPLGMPDAVRQAAVTAVDGAVHYPPADGAPLVRALARHHDRPEGCFLAGGGSTELLFLLPLVLRPRRALVVTPAFSEYERALRLSGAAVDRFPLDPERQFALDPQRLLAALSPGTDLVLVANPGNPSGTPVSPAALEEVARATAGRAELVVDEAFVDFSPGHSLLPRVAEHPNLWVLRSLTKFYAVPGLRCGYLAGPLPGVARLAQARLPWTLSTPALAAALACLEAESFRARTLELIPVLREELRAGLEELGLETFSSAANYLLARLGCGRSAAALAAALEADAILIRPCGDFPPLDDRYFRVAVRTGEENRRLLRVLGRLPDPGSA